MIDSYSGIKYMGPSTQLLDFKKEPMESTPEKVKNFFDGDFWKSISAGMCVGSIGLSLNLVAKQLIHPLFCGFMESAQRKRDYHIMTRNLSTVVIKGPIIEELVYRVLIQDGFRWIAHRVLPDRDVEVFSCKMKLEVLASIIVSSTFFGMAHYSDGWGLYKVLAAGITGFAYGVLRKEYGVLGSISAHITNNALAFCLSKIVAR